MIRIASLALTGLMLSAAPAALAQDAAAPAQELKGAAVGATVYGPDEQPAGTIETISGANAVLSTGTNKITIPLDRLGKGPNGPTIGLTRAQLDALAGQASAQASAQLQEQLKPGASVRGTSGTVVGSVKELDAETVTLSAQGKDVRVPKAAISAAETGLMINMTAEQFQAAVDAVTQ
jgi:preprotein translocase subunit YajC